MTLFYCGNFHFLTSHSFTLSMPPKFCVCLCNHGLLHQGSHTPFPHTQTNSYQAILITNGTHSYAIFTYQCGSMGWARADYSDATYGTIGYWADGDFFKNHPLSGISLANEIACVNTFWSNLGYRLHEGIDGNFFGLVYSFVLLLHNLKPRAWFVCNDIIIVTWQHWWGRACICGCKHFCIYCTLLSLGGEDIG